MCFLICWTPHHVARIRFLIITKAQSWDEQSTSTQEIIHMIAGKTNRSFKLIKFEFIEFQGNKYNHAIMKIYFIFRLFLSSKLSNQSISI